MITVSYEVIQLVQLLIQCDKIKTMCFELIRQAGKQSMNRSWNR